MRVESVGCIIRYHRERRKITKKQLAQYLCDKIVNAGTSFTESYISNIECGSLIPKLDVLWILCEKFSLSKEHLTILFTNNHLDKLDRLNNRTLIKNRFSISDEIDQYCRLNMKIRCRCSSCKY